jgi:hypothetical protein
MKKVSKIDKKIARERLRHCIGLVFGMMVAYQGVLWYVFAVSLLCAYSSPVYTLYSTSVCATDVLESR